MRIGLQDAVGLNYTQHDIDGHIYAVHDQIESRGLWYNSDIFEKAGITEDAFANWDSFAAAMEKIRALDEDVYGYIAGQGSSYIVNTVMASTDEGKAMLESELTEDTINSDEFANAFKTQQSWIRTTDLSTQRMTTETLWLSLIQMAKLVFCSMAYGMQAESTHPLVM